MKKLIRIGLFILLGLVVSSERLPIRNWVEKKAEALEIKSWLGKKTEALAMEHADKLPLARIGEYLFDKNCAICHDDPVMKAPTRKALSALSKENLMIAMEFGKMQPMAAHLSKQKRGLIALYLGADDAEQYQWLAAAKCSHPNSADKTPRVSNWGLGFENRRFVSAEQAGIDAANVADLSLAWSFAFPKVTDMRSQPVIIGDTIYVGDKAGMLYALDRHTGCVINHRKILTGLRSAITLAELKDGRRLLVFANSLATVFAVDPESLEIIWQQRASLSDYSIITGSISYYDERLFVPISAYEVAAAGSPAHECCKSHGAVIAMDANTGKNLWVWHATADAQLVSTAADGKESYGPSGASVWTTPAIDVQRQRIYFGTGENLSHPATDTSDAIIALDINTGILIWKFQATKDDVWNAACLSGGPNCPENAGEDFDFGASVIIADLANGKQLLLAGQKSGEVFALDPDPQAESGQVVWRNRISQGTSNGGVHWGMALAGERLFVPIADPERDTPGYTPRPGLSALDINSGEVIWQQAVSRGCEFNAENTPPVGLESTRSGSSESPEQMYKCSYYYGLSAAATATTELVFSAGLDGNIRAFDNRDGQLLWQTQTAIPLLADNGVPGHGGAIDVAGQVLTDGWLYVLSGYSMFGQLPGNLLLAYKLDPEPLAEIKSTNN